MNPFESELERARNRQRRFYWLAAGVLFIAVAATGAAIALTTGTPIEVRPKEASDGAVVRVKSGAALAIGSVLYSLTSEPAISVSAVGYVTAERAVTRAERGGTVEVTLRELPGKLRIKTVPPVSGVRWLVDGNLVHQGSELNLERPEGHYRVEADQAYFERRTLEIDLERGRVIQKQVSLNQLLGKLDIRSMPADSTVFVDGQMRGQTPQSLELSGGSYKVEVRRNDYLPVTERVEITNRRPNIQREYRLTKRPGFVRLEVSPKEGKLLLNGKTVKDSTDIEVAADSENRVSYFADGYFSKTVSARVGPGKKKAIEIKLEPELGEISILSRPDARVYAGGKELGQTPLTTRLPAIPQTIELRRPGYRTVVKAVTPSGKGTVQISENLVAELAARLREAPKEYVNKAGIALVLFQPGSFQMGAPRHEPGQRANEFLRRIKLEKPFYAGKYEITNQQYSKFRPKHVGTPNEPATSVTWMEAALFSNWLSAQEGLPEFYKLSGTQLAGFDLKSDGYRLLTEAEWEWLARKAGKKSETIYPWGNKPTVPNKAGNLADESAKGVTRFYVPRYTDGFARAATVGSFGPEASGLFDLTGNVSEWVNDFYSLVPPSGNAVEIDPIGTVAADSHTVKGASWRSASRSKLRAAYRDGLSNKADDVGFRVGRYLWGGARDEE